MGRGKKKKQGEDGTTNIYLKVLATFKCGKDECGKIWNSAHGWSREEIDCESCGKQSQLVNAVDEVLKLDSYNCPNPRCEGNFWQSIHFDGDVRPEQCDICGRHVLPEKNPQERYGRHYWFECKNKACKNPQEWEDFQVGPQYTQRCTRCNTQGVMVKVQKLKNVPPSVYAARRRRQGGDGDSDRPGKPSSHVAEFCDMCQKIIREGKGRSCHSYKMVATKNQKNSDGTVSETIQALN